MEVVFNVTKNGDIPLMAEEDRDKLVRLDTSMERTLKDVDAITDSLVDIAKGQRELKDAIAALSADIRSVTEKTKLIERIVFGVIGTILLAIVGGIVSLVLE